MEIELEEATATWRIGKSLGLSTFNDGDAIQASFEEKRQMKSDRRKRSKTRSKNMKKKHREK